MNHEKHRCRFPMRLKRKEAKPFKCSGCEELGFGPRYQCSKNFCHFVLYEACFKPHPKDPPKTHPITGNCIFEFLCEPPGGSHPSCDACRRDIRGFVYHDRDQFGHKLNFHPCCMNLKKTVSVPRRRMKLTLVKDKVPYKCVKCEWQDQNVATKWRFRESSCVSSCGNYCYHVYCVKKLIQDNWEKGYFNGSVASSSSWSSRGRRLDVRGKTTAAASSSSTSLIASVASFFWGSATTASSSSSSTPASKIEMEKAGFSVIISVLFGNPTSQLATLVENLLD